MPMNMKNKTDEEVLEEVARQVRSKVWLLFARAYLKEIFATKDDLEYNDTRSEKAVAVYMSIPFNESVAFYDGSVPEPGVWVYTLEEVPTTEWIATTGVRIRFIDRKSSS